MTAASPRLVIEPAVTRLGITARYLVARNLRNRASDPAFEAARSALCERLRDRYTEEFLARDPVVAGFRELRRRVGRSNRRFPSSTEALIGVLRRTGTAPAVNLAVDVYNLVSLESRLTLGGHDLARVRGDVVLGITRGGERFHPLGSSREEQLPAGEYAYTDGSGQVLCRMDHRQADETKVSLDTTACFYIIQGNPNTSREQLEEAAARLADLVRIHCGGDEVVLEGGPAEQPPDTPVVS